MTIDIYYTFPPSNISGIAGKPVRDVLINLEYRRTNIVKYIGRHLKAAHLAKVGPIMLMGIWDRYYHISQGVQNSFAPSLDQAANPPFLLPILVSLVQYELHVHKYYNLRSFSRHAVTNWKQQKLVHKCQTPCRTKSITQQNTNTHTYNHTH